MKVILASLAVVAFGLGLLLGHFAVPRQEEHFLAQGRLVIFNSIVLELPESWSSSHDVAKTNLRLTSKDGVTLLLVEAVPVVPGGLQNAKRIRLRREHIPLIVQDLTYGGELQYHVYDEGGGRSIEGFIVRDATIIHFEGYCPRAARSGGEQLEAILATTRGLL